MVTEAELHDALQWETGRAQPPDKNVFEWLWEAVQGDFNDNRSTGQIAFDAAISVIPGVDQICDVRDIIANCRSIATSEEGQDNSWKWVALVLTLIGLFPSLGSVVKGVLKIFFLFMRRNGLNKLIKAADDAMTWVVTYLRKREVQAWLRQKKVDEAFKWLADQVKHVKGMSSHSALLGMFDRGIGLMKSLLGKVATLPVIGRRARATIEMVEKVRKMADAQIGKALEPVHKILDAVIRRLEMESLVQRSGILDAKNVHFRGTLPEARAVTLMRDAEPLPAWLSKGKNVKWSQQSTETGRALIDKATPRGWSDLGDTNIASFHKMAAVEIKGPARLYRVVSPSNSAMSDCWMPEEVWNKIMRAPDPKAAWRKYCAVWPDWNPNGQFVVLEIPPGESLKVWRGPASSQTKVDHPDLNVHLEGGWEQIIFKPLLNQLDHTRYYLRSGENGAKLHPPGLSRDDWLKLTSSKRNDYTPLRERINHPGIRGPLETDWGSTDFDAQLRDAKIGLPTLPGQVTN